MGPRRLASRLVWSWCRPGNGRTRLVRAATVTSAVRRPRVAHELLKPGMVETAAKKPMPPT